MCAAESTRHLYDQSHIKYIFWVKIDVRTKFCTPNYKLVHSTKSTQRRRPTEAHDETNKSSEQAPSQHRQHARFHLISICGCRCVLHGSSMVNWSITDLVRLIIITRWLDNDTHFVDQRFLACGSLSLFPFLVLIITLPYSIIIIVKIYSKRAFVIVSITHLLGAMRFSISLFSLLLFFVLLFLLLFLLIYIEMERIFRF